MAGLDLAALTGPVSADDPCGPDLDLEGDPDYFNFLARAEGLLPASFFSGPDGGPFDRSAINFDNEFAAMAPLFERTRDLRLAALLARLHILNRNIAGFSMAVSAIAQLVDEQWEGVHPRGEDGDFLLRMTAIETLDDMPTVVLPMQFLPLALHRRAGQINYRGYLIATGEVRAREGEEALDTGSIDRALMEVDLPPLIETMRQFDAVNKTLLRIRQIWIDRAGFDQAVAIEKSAQLAGRIVTLLNGVVARRDPAAALGEAAGAPASDADGQDGAAAAGAPPAAAAPAAGAPISLG
ncbi:MAG: type VI secretion system ImpA family N-terminal domain-containing protein, partial [Rhizobiales bacterium]|nr:type VI secretion system ImpA family N-terminal domain-containing protein [Hyphomicrobiales bacterium]